MPESNFLLSLLLNSWDHITEQQRAQIFENAQKLYAQEEFMRTIGKALILSHMAHWIKSDPDQD